MGINAFTIFGELKAETGSFVKNLRSAEDRLESTTDQLTLTESIARKLGDQTQKTGRQFEKFREQINAAENKLTEAVSAFNKGEISSKRFAQTLASADKSFSGINSRIKDMSARLGDAGNKTSSFISRMSLASTAGNLASNAISNFAGKLVDAAKDGIRLNASLDKLVRFTATLDKNFQNTIALRRFTDDIKKLSTEIPFNAEKIAEASFSIKSAFSDLNEPQTIEFLRQFGIGAASSNADIAEFTKNTIALAKVFKVELKDLPTFMAKINATFKDGLAADSEVAKGFNQTVTSITSLKLSMEDYLAVMSTVQSTTANASEATTNLHNLFAKLNDGKYIEGLKEIFNIDRFTKDGKLKEFNQIINEIAKSLDGLTLKDRTEKINAVFKDLQAKEGLLAVLANLDKYNAKLKDTSGAESFTQTHNLMMDAVENRWTKLWNNVTNSQSKFGGGITDFFLTAFDSTTVEGGIALFFNEIGQLVLTDLAGIAEKMSNAFRYFGESFAGFFGADSNVINQFNQKIDGWFQSAKDAIAKQSDANTQTILQLQKKSWQKIAEATANPEAKATALKNVDNLTKAIQSSANRSLSDTYNSFSEVMKSVVAGLASGNAAVKQQAQASAQSLVDSINSVLANPSLDPALAQEFRNLLEALKKTAEQYGVTLQNVAYRIGSNIGSGLVQGMNAQQGAVIQAAHRLANSATVSASSTLQEASPSKVFIEIGKNIVLGLVNGISDNSKLVVNAVSKMAKEMIATAKEDLGKLSVEFQALKSDKLFEIKIKSFGIEQAKKALEDVIQLRLELGKNLDVPLPKTLEEINAELKQLEILKDAPEKLNDKIKELGDYVQKLNEQFAPEKWQIDVFAEMTQDLEVLAGAAKAAGQSIDDFVKAGVKAAEKADFMKMLDLISDTAPKFDDKILTQIPNRPTFSKPGAVEGIKPEALTKTQEILSRIRQNLGLLNEDIRTSGEKLGDFLTDTFDRVGSIFKNAINSTNGFFKGVLDGFKEFAKQMIAEMLALLAVAAMVGLLQGLFGGGGFGAGFKSGFKNTIKSNPGNSMGGDLLGSIGGFANGGFTGFGGKFEPAGIVHKGEYVFSQEDIRQAGGVGNVEAFAKGGGNSRPINISLNVHGVKDAESFKKSEGQIKRGLLASLRQAELQGAA